MKKWTGETLNLSRNDIVIASQGDRLLGIAVLKKDARGRAADVSVSLMAACTGA